MASLALDNAEVKRAIAQVLGIGRDPTAWGVTLVSDVDDVIRRGRRKFFSAADWRFLRVHTSFLTAAPQETGTVECVSGVVTLTGSTFPATAATNYLFANSTGFYEIESRDSPTQLTLKDTSSNSDVAALSSYSLHLYKFDLPGEFAGFVGPVGIENNDILRQYAVLPEFELRTFHNRTSVCTGKPKAFAVTSRLADEDLAVPTFELVIYPLADAVYRIEADIKLALGDSLDDADSVVHTHSAFSNCMLEAILSEAEVMLGNFEGVHAAKYEVELVNAKRIDGAMRGVRRSLSRNQRLNRDPLRDLKLGTSTWPGE